MLEVNPLKFWQDFGNPRKRSLITV